MDVTSQNELLRMFQTDRSEAAFAGLVRQYSGLVYSVARRRLPNATLAEDITQIVFIRLAQSPPRVGTAAELAAWLHRTTLHVAIDTWRAETRRHSREQRAAVLENESVPAEGSLWEEISPQLDAALDQLDDDDRQALLLRFFSSKPMREIGASFGISEDAAKMRVRRALDRLRDKLGIPAAGAVGVLAATLESRALELVPATLTSQLRLIKLPTAIAATTLGLGSWLTSLFSSNRGQLATGAVVLVLLAAFLLHHFKKGANPAKPSQGVAAARSPAIFDSKLNRRRLADGSGADRPTHMILQVVDADTGQGLPGARVQVSREFFREPLLFTDQDGRVAIPEPHATNRSPLLNISAEAQGYVAKIAGFLVEIPPDFNGVIMEENLIQGNPSSYTLRLARGKTLSGVVLNESGQPLDKVRLRIADSILFPDRGPERSFLAESIVTNRADGSWSVNGYPTFMPNEIHFVLNRSGYGVNYATVSATNVDLNHLVFILHNGFTIAGRIVDANGEPITNAFVQTFPPQPLIRRELGRQSSVDEQGNFTMRGVNIPPGSPTPFSPTALDGVARAGSVTGEQSTKVPKQLRLQITAEGFATNFVNVPLAEPTNRITVVLAANPDK